MPRARYTAEGGTYRVGGHSFDPGEERAVDAQLADYLADHDAFDVVDAGDGAAAQEDEPPDEGDTEGEDVEKGESESEAGEAFDVDEFLDRNVDPVADDISAGAADEHLDAIADAAERVTVQDAIGERRADLEE